MKKIAFVLCCTLLLASSSYGQASATWPLTANQSAIVAGSVSAPDQALSNIQVSYSSSVQRSSPTPTAGSWPGDAAEVGTRYMQFTVIPNSGISFTATAISMKLYVNSGSSMKANVYYSTDSSFAVRTQMGTGTYSLSSTAPTTANVTAVPNVSVVSGQAFYVRIYPWYTTATTGKYVITNSVVISGTAQSMVAVLPSVSQLTGFLQQPSGSPSPAQTYTVSGTNLSDNVVLTAPANFEISTDAGSTWSGTGSPITLVQSGGNIAGQPVSVSVRLNASAAGSYSGTITHTSSGAAEGDVVVRGAQLTVEPTVASTVSFSAVGGSAFTVNFSGGDGSGRVVLLRAGNPVTAVPSDGSSVDGANANFTAAPDQGSGNKAVYTGTGNTVAVTGLSSNVTYYAAVYEYNTAGDNTENYLTSSAGTGSQATAAVATLSASKASISFGNVVANATSAEASFSLSGVYLTPSDGNITIAAPAGFEVSATSGTGFAPTIQLAYAGSALAATTIYVHFVPAGLTSYSDNCSITGGGAPAISLPVSGNGVSELVATNTPVGFASCGTGTTGGAGGDTVVITDSGTLNTLLTARQKNVVTPVVYYISGTLSSPGDEIDIKRTNNVSILGIGNNAVIDGWGFKMTEANNIIIRNIKFMNCTAGEGDAVSVESSHNIWVDHNWFTDAPGDSSNEIHDGQTDIKKGSTNVTVSYNHYQHHRKTSLLGFSTSDAEDTLSTVTYYRNWFDGTYSRHPRVRYAHPHILNNYFRETGMWGADSGGYAIGATCGCQIYAEGNYFEHVRTPFLISGVNDPGGILSHDPIGYLKSVNNYFFNTSAPITQDTDVFSFNPSNYYVYTADDPLTVKATVMANVGVGILDITGPAIVTSVNSFSGLPAAFALKQNYPNPFNPTTMIAFTVKERALTTLKVFNVLGQEVATLFRQVAEPGRQYQTSFRAQALPSGMYFSVLESAGQRESKRMLLLK